MAYSRVAALRDTIARHSYMAESMGTAILNIGTSDSLTKFISEAMAAERDSPFEFFTVATEAIQASKCRRLALIVAGRAGKQSLEGGADGHCLMASLDRTHFM